MLWAVLRLALNGRVTTGRANAADAGAADAVAAVTINTVKIVPITETGRRSISLSFGLCGWDVVDVINVVTQPPLFFGKRTSRHFLCPSPSRHLVFRRVPISCLALSLKNPKSDVIADLPS